MSARHPLGSAHAPEPLDVDGTCAGGGRLCPLDRRTQGWRSHLPGAAALLWRPARPPQVALLIVHVFNGRQDSQAETCRQGCTVSAAVTRVLENCRSRDPAHPCMCLRFHLHASSHPRICNCMCARALAHGLRVSVRMATHAFIRMGLGASHCEDSNSTRTT